MLFMMRRRREEEEEEGLKNTLPVLPSKPLTLIEQVEHHVAVKSTGSKVEVVKECETRIYQGSNILVHGSVNSQQRKQQTTTLSL